MEIKFDSEDFGLLFHSVGIDVNDTFAYACSDEERMDWDDFLDVIPMIKEYGCDALIAYAALKRGCDPIPPLITDEFKKCKELLIQKMKDDNLFCVDYNEEILDRLNKETEEKS